MASVFQLEVKGDKAVIQHLNQIKEKLPEAIKEAGAEFGESLQFRIKRQITVSRLIWTKALHKSVRWVKTRDGGHLRLLGYGVELDTKAVQPVPVRKGSILWRWAFDPAHHRGAGRFPALEKKLYSTRTMTLHPHPFLEAPLRRTITDLPRILKKKVSNTIQTRGRA